MQAIKFQRPFMGIVVPKLLLLVYVLITIKLLWGYFLWDFTAFLGLALAPYTCTVKSGKLSLRYLIPAVLTAGIALTMPVNTILFLALLFTVLLLIENFKGEISFAVFFLIILISPIFKYISNLISFPIRLWLSEVVADILSGAGLQAIASGNIIELNGYDFSVDQACAGLNMLSTSFIICLFIIAFYQKKVNKQLSFFKVVLLLSLTFALNIGCNLIRILILVLFKIMPSSLFHDLVGFSCLIIYVIVPLLFVSKIYFKRCVTSKQDTITQQSVFNNTPLRYVAIHISLFIIIVFTTFNLKRMDKIQSSTVNNIVLKGFKKEILESAVIKFENKESLIYLKPTPFYAPEHSPMICWRGNGYDFESIKKETIAGKEIYTGVLVKGKAKIYSAWWFDNGKTKTINQLDWRWEAAKGGSEFYLVNVNVSSPLNLNKLVKSMMERQ